ncbi:meiotic recombination protein REC8 homolog [Astyanax mexicanus]|uniref:meiotic recombination protein REC8 homolog n=1 Tax=Astyanax mexicanus TaxID=7994 RepID=UPI0020CB408D|nr:meiotic recombination protein REC8 homolog [Astyanax mexicanus]
MASLRLAATKGKKISRRDFLKVNVQHTCTGIMNYVLVRVPPPSVGLPRPRFSLYLSSQLQYGVVIVYHRQCQLLLEDIQEAIDRLLRFRAQVQIDMPQEDIRQPHTIPDALTLLNETEGARDPFFGSMEFSLPSPSSLIELAQDIEKMSPQRQSPERAVTPPPDGITASQESITLMEREPEPIPEPEFEGAELQDFNMIEMLMEQPDDFFMDEEERQRERERERERQRQQETERETGRERDREQEQERERESEREEDIQRERERAAAETERLREITKSTISLEQIQTPEVPSRDIVLEAEEAMGLPMEMPEPVERELTPISESLLIPPSPPSPVERREEPRESPRLEPVPISPQPLVEQRRRRRRRQRLVIDELTQIPLETMQAQINDLNMETKSLADILVKSPSQQSDPKTLLSNPCTSFPPEILELWKQCAVIRPIPPLPQREEVREEEEQREEPEEKEAEPEIASKEVPREMGESGISQYETQVSSLVMLETTEREMSPMETPETQRSPIPISLHGLEDIAEERVPELEEIPMETESQLGEVPTFHSLLPPAVNRRTVAQTFWRLLERMNTKEVTVQQDEPYGDIFITQTERPKE